jgi:MFS family permease
VTSVTTELPIYDRYLRSYPGTAERTYYLVVTVMATVALYYMAYCGGTVAPQILNHYGITIKFYLLAAVVGFLLGAIATVLGGLADKLGRVNLVAYGLLAVGFLVAFVQPRMPDKWTFVAVASLVGLIEGVILVATPALMRDFSPRMGRATTMGFWALGPVLGSLLAAEVSSHTLGHLHAWQDQFLIAGIAGLGVSVLVIYTLRELDPALRSQVMVSLQDRALVEARAKGIDVESSIRQPWKQMITPRIVSSAFAIGVSLMFYYSLVGALVIFLETNYRLDGSQANGVANWCWFANAVALVAFGFASDRLRVRKPFMLAGGLGSLAAILVFVSVVTNPHTSTTTLALILSVQAIFGAMVFSPWMAGYTETVEDRNPALMATGLAVSGGVLRIIVGATIFAFPFVVPAVTPLVDYGPQIQQYATEYTTQLQTAQSIDPATLAVLQRDPSDGLAITAAVGQIGARLHLAPPAALSRLVALGQAAPKLAYLAQHAPAVLAAEKQNPGQWRDWWLVTAAGQVLFLPFVFAMVGAWTPAAGRRRDEEQERQLQAAVEAMV